MAARSARGAGGAVAQSQRVYMYCDGKEEAARVASFCNETRQIPKLPEVVAPSDRIPAVVAQLKLTLQKLPRPYESCGWHEFARDVDALQVASSTEAARRIASSGASNHPALIVTDLERMCKVFADGNHHSVFADAAHLDLKVSDLLPVVLAKDFTRLCGEAMLEPPVHTMRSKVLDNAAKPTDVAAAAPEPEAPVAATSAEQGGDDAPSRQQSGIEKQGSRSASKQSVVQKQGSRSASKQSVVQEEEATAESVEGSAGGHERRSSDAQTSANWQERGTDKVTVTPGVYVQRWEPPSDSPPESLMINDSPAPLYGARCLALLSSGEAFYSAVSFDGTRGVEVGGRWDVFNGQLVIVRHGCTMKHLELLSPVANRPDDYEYDELVHVPLEELRDAFAKPISLAACVPKVCDALQEDLARVRARCDALCQIPDPFVAATLEGPSQSRQPFATPRLAPQEVPAAGVSASESRRRVSKMRNADGASSAFAICSLRPGVYRYQLGAPCTMEYRYLEVALRADRTYKYSETIFNATLKLIHRKPIWHVEGDTLILGCVEGGQGVQPGFEHLCPRGRLRKLQTHIQRVELSVTAILETCTFEPVQQLAAPFPKREPFEAEELVGGIIFSKSLALKNPSFDPDEITLPGFEATLHRAGFNADDGISDLSFLDEDRNGSIDAAELEPLSKYPDAMASPELMCSLCETLLEVFEGDLIAAFTKLRDSCRPDQGTEGKDDSKAKAKAKGKAKAKAEPAPAPKTKASAYKITVEGFKTWLSASAKQPDGKALSTWLEGVGANDVDAVFASMDPENRRFIEQEDFMSLLLHRGMAVIKTLDHFRRWLVGEFGNTPSDFARAFKLIASDAGEELEERDFVSGVQHIKYPAAASASQIFALLDVNFDGTITERELQMLRNFSLQQFSKSMMTLKAFVMGLQGGFDFCFRNLQSMDEKMTGKSKETVEFDSLQRAFRQSGLERSSVEKDERWTDLRMICLFLNIAAETHCPGEVTSESFSLVQSFDPRAFDGSPVRLRQFLEATYGSMNEAFHKLRASWLPHALSERLERLAFSGLMNAFMGNALVDVLNASINHSSVADHRSKTTRESETTDHFGMTLSIVEEQPQKMDDESDSWVAAWQSKHAGLHTPYSARLGHSARHGTASMQATGLSSRAKATMMISRLAPLPMKITGEAWLPQQRVGRDGDLGPEPVVLAGMTNGQNADTMSWTAASWVPTPRGPTMSSTWRSGTASFQRSMAAGSEDACSVSTSGGFIFEQSSSQRASARGGAPQRLEALATPRKLPNIGTAPVVPPLNFPKGKIVSFLPCTPRVPRFKPGGGATTAIDWSF